MIGCRPEREKGSDIPNGPNIPNGPHIPNRYYNDNPTKHLNRRTHRHPSPNAKNQTRRTAPNFQDCGYVFKTNNLSFEDVPGGLVGEQEDCKKMCPSPAGSEKQPDASPLQHTPTPAAASGDILDRCDVSPTAAPRRQTSVPAAAEDAVRKKAYRLPCYSISWRFCCKNGGPAIFPVNISAGLTVPTHWSY